MRVTSYFCDRCKEKQDTWKYMAVIIFIGKQKEICKKCQEDLKLWLKKYDKNK